MNQSTGSQTRGFLFADLRDYTQFVEAWGDQAAAELVARYRVLVRDVISAFDGAEIRTEGDSFYVVFASASAAVNGGLAILAAAAAAGRESAPMRVGVGVHAGETAETADGLIGSAVNLAARICAIAGPGELLVSDTVRGLTRTFLPVQFVPRGRRRLKGVGEPVAIYLVVPGRAGGAGAAIGKHRRRRNASVLLAAAGGVALAAVAGVALVGFLVGAGPFGGLASPTDNPSGSGAEASPGADSSARLDSGLASAEEELRAKLPAAIEGNCRSASAADGSAGGSVSLRCELPLSAAADEVWVDQFATSDAVDGAFSDEVSRTQAPPGDCDETTQLAHGPWEVPNVHAGQLLCYQEDGAAWLVWTYDDERILIKARRVGADWAELYAWWRQTAIFLR